MYNKKIVHNGWTSNENPAKLTYEIEKESIIRWLMVYLTTQCVFPCMWMCLAYQSIQTTLRLMIVGFTSRTSLWTNMYFTQNVSPYPSLSLSLSLSPLIIFLGITLGVSLFISPGRVGGLLGTQYWKHGRLYPTTWAQSPKNSNKKEFMHSLI